MSVLENMFGIMMFATLKYACLLASAVVLVLGVVVEQMKLVQHQQAFHDHSLQVCLTVVEPVTTSE